ncbi:nucleotidyltransferase domain-containing protein [Eubacteriales bacterium OttesenSCG-928-K08]|nr:nucleotidyltransferase domain-containing protein [Eubacteriales bacterium OttesenSCG-928-K08]
MLDIELWVQTLTEKLRAAFQNRLLFVGLQGSYARGEAHAGSDIDIVVLVDSLSLDDLKRYKAVLDEMPHRELACGFVSDRQTLLNWPKHELFQFIHDTKPVYGTMENCLPSIDREDVATSVKISASGIYHACCHSFLHGEDDTEALKGLYKGAFFLLQATHYLHSGSYVRTKRELLSLLEGTEQEILSISMNWEAHQEEIAQHPDGYFEKLITWTSRVIKSP